MTLRLWIVTRHRLELLKPCLHTALSALGDLGKITVVVNGEDQATGKWLSGFKDSRLEFLSIAGESRSHARNRAFHALSPQEEIIYFLDDDVLVPNHLFREALAKFSADKELAVMGGPNLTPEESPFLEQCFGAVMGSHFAAPFVSARYREEGTTDKLATEHDLILCNLAVRRSLVPLAIQFESMRSNEENLFLFRCEELGLKTVYSPHLYVYHRRRATLGSFARQVSSYGQGRGEQWWREPRSVHPIFLVPSVTLLWTVLSPFFFRQWLPLAMSLYGVGVLMGVITHPGIRKLGLKGMATCAVLNPCVHLSYAVGSWKAFGDGLGLGLRALRRVALSPRFFNSPS